MWCSKVLVAYDGSAPSAKALHLARSIGAQDESVELVFAHVVKLYGLAPAPKPCCSTREEGAGRNGAACRRSAEQGARPPAEGQLAGRSPAEMRARRGCDLIVMGSRGQGGVKGFLAASATPWCRDRLSPCSSRRTLPPQRRKPGRPISMPAIAREKLWTRDFVFGTAVNFLIMVNYYGSWWS